MVSTKTFLCFLFLCQGVKANDEVMKKMSIQMGFVVVYCQDKNGTPSEVVDQIRHFWDEDFQPTAQLGCLIECAFKRLEIINPEGKLSIPNGKAFLRACGADSDTANKLGQAMGSNCPVAGTGCAAALAYAQCFRGLVLMLHMQPGSFAKHG